MTDTIITNGNNTTIVTEQPNINVVSEGTKQPSVVVTGVMGPPGSANVRMNMIRDVDMTQLENGAVLVYNASTSKWYATNLLDHQVIESGQF